MQLPDGRLLRCALLLAVLAGAGAGCSGVNASGSASPASFFLPGLLKADPPRPPLEPVCPALPDPQEVALVR